MTRLLLIRHCQSTGQAPDAPLSDLGRAQSFALADYLAGHDIDYVVTSPYLRARETIAPFAGRSGLAVAVDERLAERRMSPAPIDDWRDVVEASFRDLDHRLAGGESGRDTLTRAWAAIEAVAASKRRMAAVVTHGQLMSLVLHAIDASFGFRGWESLTNPDVYAIESEGGFYRFTRTWAAPPAR